MNGLRCAIDVTRRMVRVGDEFVVGVKVQNLLDEPTHLYYETIYRAIPLVVTTEEGEALQKRMTARYDVPHPKAHFQQIAPGDTLDVEIRGRVATKFVRAADLPARDEDRIILLDFGDTVCELPGLGTYAVHLDLAATDKTVAQGKSLGIDPVWLGRLVSPAAKLAVRRMAPAELDAVIETLRTGNEEQQLEAIEVIKAVADRRAVPALMAVLDAGPGPLARKVSDALVRIQDTSVAPRLLALYRRFSVNRAQDPNEYLPALLGAIQGLSPDPAAVAGLFVEILESDAPVQAKQSAAWRLFNIDHPGRIPALLAAAKSGVPRVQWSAVDVLGVIASQLPPEEKDKITTPLTEIMKTDPDRKVRSRVAHALAQAGDPSVVPALIEALGDADPWVGAAAASTLGRIGTQEAVAPLEQFAAEAENENHARIARDAIKFIEQRTR